MGVSKRTKEAAALEMKPNVSEEKTAVAAKGSISRKIPTIKFEKPDEFWKYFGTGLFLASMMFFALFYMGKQEVKTPFVKYNETVIQRAHLIPCSDKEYPEDFVRLGTGCVPVHCKRVVKDDIIPESDLKYLQGMVERVFKYGASILKMSWVSMHTGRFLKSFRFTNLYELPDAKEIFTDEDFAVYNRVTNLMKEHVSLEFGVPMEKFYVNNQTAFMKMSNDTAKVGYDYTTPHVDKEDSSSFYTVLLYFNTYMEDFQGGRLSFVDQHSNLTIEPKRGRMILYTAGYENVHSVEEVTYGSRITFVLGFTCDITTFYPNPTMNNFTMAE